MCYQLPLRFSARVLDRMALLKSYWFNHSAAEPSPKWICESNIRVSPAVVSTAIRRRCHSSIRVSRFNSIRPTIRLRLKSRTVHQRRLSLPLTPSPTTAIAIALVVDVDVVAVAAAPGPQCFRCSRSTQTPSSLETPPPLAAPTLARSPSLFAAMLTPHHAESRPLPESPPPARPHQSPAHAEPRWTHHLATRSPATHPRCSVLARRLP